MGEPVGAFEKASGLTVGSIELLSAIIESSCVEWR